MIRAFSLGFGGRGHLAQRLEAFEDLDRPLGLLQLGPDKDRVAPGGFPPGAPTDPNVRN